MLTYIDASPEQLALAIGGNSTDAKNVLDDFLECFTNQADLRGVLGHATAIVPLDCEGPGWFRYLVLTCLIAAMSPSQVAAADYRERLRVSLNLDSQIADLSGIAKLWHRLEKWCQDAITKGEPFRRIRLPYPSWMRQIGHSQAMAFPSWRDRERLRSLINSHQGDFNNATSTIWQIHSASKDWSQGFHAVFEDFEKRYNKGDRLLVEHPFWTLVSELLSQTRSPKSNHLGAVLQLKLLADQDGDIVFELSSDIKIVVGQRGPEESKQLGNDAKYTLTRSFGGIADALLHRRVNTTAGEDLTRAISRGLLIFCEENWGEWLFTTQPDRNSRPRIVSKSRITLNSSTTWLAIEDGWYLSGVISAADAIDQLIRESARTNDVGELQKLRVFNGIRIGQCYLGRSSVLPLIKAVPNCNCTVEPKELSSGQLSLAASAIENSTYNLISSAHLSGTWSLEFSEDGNDPSLSSELRIKFLERAIEHGSYLEPGENWVLESESESEPDDHAPSPTIQPYPFQLQIIPQNTDDLLEAIYAGGQSGWSERDLIQLLNHLFPNESPWDALRLLRESNWLQPCLGRRWGTRRWYLKKPQLIAVGKTQSILDGSVCSAVRERFENVATRLGGSLEIRLHNSSLTIPFLLVSGICPKVLAQEIGDISIKHVDALNMSLSKNLGTGQSIHHYKLASKWNWDLGCFQQGNNTKDGGVTLERWTRPQKDAHDLYVVTRESEKIVFNNRLISILEAFKYNKRSLFLYQNASLKRTTKDGYLPDMAAGALRIKHLSNPYLCSGPESTSTYVYPADMHDVYWLRRILGDAVSSSETPKQDNNFILSRRLGSRRASVLAEYFKELR